MAYDFHDRGGVPVGAIAQDRPLRGIAREIVQREHVPVGVIDATWGGTIAES